MDGDWKSSVGCQFTSQTLNPSTVVRVSALETGRGSSMWVWLQATWPVVEQRTATCETDYLGGNVEFISRMRSSVGYVVHRVRHWNDGDSDRRG